jgi:hypothetical protein
VIVRDSLRLIEEARARGIDVTADQYPYTSGSTIFRGGSAKRRIRRHW